MHGHDYTWISTPLESLHLTYLLFFADALQVHDAGHLVPMDQPKNSLEMLYRWTRGKSLGNETVETNIIKQLPSKSRVSTSI